MNNKKNKVYALRSAVEGSAIRDFFIYLYANNISRREEKRMGSFPRGAVAFFTYPQYLTIKPPLRSRLEKRKIVMSNLLKRPPVNRWR